MTEYEIKALNRLITTCKIMTAVSALAVVVLMIASTKVTSPMGEQIIAVALIAAVFLVALNFGYPHFIVARAKNENRKVKALVEQQRREESMEADR